MNGRKRHIAVDAMGRLLAVVITAASAQDRDAARPLRRGLHRSCRRVRLIWADAACTGKLTGRAATLKMSLRILANRRAHPFGVLPRRRAADRTFAWTSRHRRATRDCERLPAGRQAIILRAMIALRARRLARPARLPGTQLAARSLAGACARDRGQVLAGHRGRVPSAEPRPVAGNTGPTPGRR